MLLTISAMTEKQDRLRVRTDQRATYLQLTIPIALPVAGIQFLAI